ncbi:hypothetical protein Peur_061338 [Populus x canadensis]
MEELPLRGVIVGFLICQTPEFLLAYHQSCKVELVSFSFLGSGILSRLLNRRSNTGSNNTNAWQSLGTGFTMKSRKFHKEQEFHQRWRAIVVNLVT